MVKNTRKRENATDDTIEGSDRNPRAKKATSTKLLTLFFQ